MPKSIYYDENGNEQILSSSPSALSGLLDTDITTPTANQVLAYDNNGKVVNSDLLDDKQEWIANGSYTTYGVWGETYYGAARMWVALPNASKYTITITGAKYRSADTTMTSITGATNILTNDCGFLVSSGSATPANHWGEVTFTLAKT